LLGRYRPVDALAKGAFGKTFVAVDEAKPSKPRCVIKQFAPKDPASASIALRLFQHEAEQLDRLGKHPQIPELMAHFEQDKRQYIVQEYVEGQNLRDEVKSNGCFNEAAITELLHSMLPVLHFIHKSGVIHRDIKPENIIRRGTDKSLFLIDFGAAKHAASETALAAPGTVIGTPHYDAPEQAVGQATFASDIYGLGATCIHLMTGQSPNYKLYSHANGGWIWREFLQDDFFSEDLGAVLDQMLARELKNRYKSAEEVLQALKALIDMTSGSIVALVNAVPAIATAPPSKKASVAAKLIVQKKKTSSLSVFELKPFKFRVATVFQKSSGLFGLTSTCEVNRFSREAEYFSGYMGLGRTFEMVFIPEGVFQMGSPETEEGRNVNESPQRVVAIAPFFIGKYPITQEQWDLVVGLPKVNRDLKLAPANFKGLSRPVERVSWFDAVEFCDRLSKKLGQTFRLPSEAEWEYACRAGTTAPFHFGEAITPDLANYNGDRTYAYGAKGKNRKESTPVGSFQVANSFGLYDMHGNVWEWCADPWHDNYHGAPPDGGVWVDISLSDDTEVLEPDGTITRIRTHENQLDMSYRILRGGSWGNDPGDCRSASRLRDLPNSEYSDYGFRIVCS
jgi:formylglycine-generating enzyme required for sulfatase activity/tRNA A-37 threonylcarbamoyl transferase component Bud32